MIVCAFIHGQARGLLRRRIKELDLAMLGTQTASIFTLRFAENAESNVPKWIGSEAQTLRTVFVTEPYLRITIDALTVRCSLCYYYLLSEKMQSIKISPLITT